jgi:hypothetical protein
MQRGLIVGRKLIAAYIGVSPKKIPLWVAEHQFPAWKGPDGRWRAVAKTIDEWVDTQAMAPKD